MVEWIPKDCHRGTLGLIPRNGKIFVLKNCKKSKLFKLGNDCMIILF